MEAAPDSLLRLELGATLAGVPGWFLVVSDPELLDSRRWLAEQPDWLELGDLLLAADWLEFRAMAGGGALLGVKSQLAVLLCEGLAWGLQADPADLAALCPPPAPTAVESAVDLDGETLLRRSAPFGPGGETMAPVGGGRGTSAGLVVAERRWRGADAAALTRVIRLP